MVEKHQTGYGDSEEPLAVCSVPFGKSWVGDRWRFRSTSISNLIRRSPSGFAASASGLRETRLTRTQKNPCGFAARMGMAPTTAKLVL